MLTVDECYYILTSPYEEVKYRSGMGFIDQQSILKYIEMMEMKIHTRFISISIASRVKQFRKFSTPATVCSTGANDTWISRSNDIIGSSIRKAPRLLGPCIERRCISPRWGHWCSSIPSNRRCWCPASDAPASTAAADIQCRETARPAPRRWGIGLTVEEARPKRRTRWNETPWGHPGHPFLFR